MREFTATNSTTTIMVGVVNHTPGILLNGPSCAN